MATATPQMNGAVTAISLIGLILFWTVLAWIKADPTVLPTPLEVWNIIGKEAASGELAHHMIATAWLVVFLNIPALVVIVLCYLWIGLNEVAAITAVALNKTAMVAVTIREGTRALDPKLDDMARSFQMAPLTRLRHVVLPQLWPFIASSTRNGLAIIWKIVLVVEFLGRSNGIGFQIHLYFQLFEIGYVMAYALSFVVFILIDYKHANLGCPFASVR